MSNFPLIRCSCNSTNVIRWGTYNRGVIYYDDNNVVREKIITIQRVKCKSCNKTHALLPNGIIPYKQLTDEVISDLIRDIFSLNREQISKKYFITEETINCIYKQFKTKHLPRISTIVRCHKIKETLTKFLKVVTNKLEYIKRFNICFMQNRIGVLVLCPS